MKPKPPTIEPLALTVPQTAEALGLHPSTIFRMLASGDLPCVRIAGKQRVLRSDLVQWLERKPRQTQAMDQAEDELIAEGRIQ